MSVFVNRWSILVRANQPYVDWANSMDDDGPTMDLESQQMQPTMYLINERDDCTIILAEVTSDDVAEHFSSKNIASE